MESIDKTSPPALSSPHRHAAGAGAGGGGALLLRSALREETMRPAEAEGQAAWRQVQRLTERQSGGGISPG